jgi:hypothetical protein
MQQTRRRLFPGRLPRWGRRALAGFAAAIGLGAAVLSGVAPAEAQDGLTIELNKVEDFEGGCMASFVFQNNLGVTLDRFNLDLFLFDAKGVIMRRVTIDMAPLPNGKTRVAQFHLYNGPCADLGQVLVNDIPQCRAETGEPVDCLAGLKVSSRSAIALAK